jgi:GH35 family endo-1,4-beta-xylanase
MANQHNLSRRTFLVLGAGAGAAATVAAMVGPAFGTQAATAVPSLKDAYKNDFLIGTALDFRNANEFNAAELEIIKTQFNVITPENSMKPGSVHPQENTWNWTQPDALVKFCQDNNIKIIGHCLAWHQQTGNWFFQNATKEVALARLKEHITTLLGRYKGKIMGWDVVNEAINDGGSAATANTENLRNSPWLSAVGPDYLTQAFKFAREADPNCELHYNDYNIESGPKHQSSLVLLKRLINDGAPINVVGIQGHWSVTGLNAQKLDQIDKAIENYKALKLKVAITELDVTMTGSGGGQFGGGGGAGATAGEAAFNAQADAYSKLFQVFLKYKDVINRITFWGLNDRRSWRNGQNPLIFDAQNQAKPALFAIANLRNGGPSPRQGN